MSSRCVLLCIAASLAMLASARAEAQIPIIPEAAMQAPQDPVTPAEQSTATSQNPAPPSTPAPDPPPATSDSKNLPDSPQPKVQQEEEAQQTRRILWVIPNYRSVTANTHLPPQTVGQKFWLATQDSFDYSAFIWVGMVAGISMADRSEPTFGQGASGYGVYYAHTFADNTIENYFVEAIVPAATRQDPRYYTLGHGGFFKRTGYSVSRLFITRTDGGHATFNVSEVVGAGAAAGIGSVYYPSTDNKWVKTYQRWGSEMFQDALSNIAKEFWPDINHAIFHNKY